MMYAGRLAVAVVLVAASVAAKPNHLKAVVVDTDPVPVVKEYVPVVKEYVPVVKEVVPEVKPGYSASVGVGGAAAHSPYGSAGVGVGPTAHKPVHQGPGLFDSIFNIPISVLQSVNTYLNNRGPIVKPAHRRRGHHPVVVDKTVPAVEQGSHPGGVPESSAGASAGASAVASAGASADAGAGAGSAGSHPSPGQGAVVLQKRVNYDDIFNIPISVLKSVNHMLNG